MSVLSNTQIVAAREKGHVVIEPYVPENVRKSSVDVTLGYWFYRGARESGGLYNPYDPGDVERDYIGPFQAKPYFNIWRKLRELDYLLSGWPVPNQALLEADEERRHGHSHARYGVYASLRAEADANGIGLVGVPDDHPVIMLLPGEFILAHTHEFIGIHPPGTTEMRARSTTGRNRTSACLCAGWGDPGYVNRWTMEIHNFGPKPVPLPVGERVAQMIFHETGPVDGGEYGNETTYESKYQHSDNIDEIVEAWTPEQMLPRSYKDARILPLEIAGAAYQ